MHFFNQFRSLVVATVCWGIIFPNPNLLAATPAQKRSETPRVETSRFETPRPEGAVATDVTLASGGVLHGQVVDGQGIGLDGAVVSLRQGGEELSRTIADQEGRFSFSELRGGVYEVRGGQGMRIYRAWSPGTAPPAARTEALVISDPQAVRGQCNVPCFDPCYDPCCVDIIALSTLALAGVAAGFAIAAYSKADDVDDRLDRIEALLASP